MEMLNESAVIMLPPDEVQTVSVVVPYVTLKEKLNYKCLARALPWKHFRHAEPPPIESITTVGGASYAAAVFIDASYEGDLMARTPNVDYTFGRESQAEYGESGAGSQNASFAYGIEYMNPYNDSGGLLPLLSPVTPLPRGEADKQIQGW